MQCHHYVDYFSQETNIHVNDVFLNLRGGSFFVITNTHYILSPGRLIFNDKEPLCSYETVCQETVFIKDMFLNLTGDHFC